LKKNVALLIPGLPFGGAERVVSRLSYILGDYYNLSIIVFDSRLSKYDCGCEVIDMALPASNSIVKKSMMVVKRGARLSKIIKQYKLDVIISFLDGANIVNLVSAKSCKKVISIRNYKSSEKNPTFISIISQYLLKKLYKRADMVVPVSKLISQNLINEYKLDPQKVAVIYNPFDVLEITKLSFEELEEPYKKFYENSKVIVTVGRKTYQKGFWHLIKAFSLVAKNIVEARLVIVGDGEQEGPIKKLVEGLGLEDKVLLAGHQKNPFRFIANSDVYVLSSLFEGFPNALVEAMACGQMIISTDCKSGPREILFDDGDLLQAADDIVWADYGVLIPPLTEIENWNSNEIEACDEILAKAMTLVLRDKKGQQYRSKVIERAQEFSYERCKKAFIDVIG